MQLSHSHIFSLIKLTGFFIINQSYSKLLENYFYKPFTRKILTPLRKLHVNLISKSFSPIPSPNSPPLPLGE